ncbi:hypothetical protein [Curtobacterium sp. B18]|uniref:hypothetical protein n=1 Tax=Curtobacterium sp. B18 TaxID=95614 RepID=UPI000347E994|nr:hypothetical protein [Curtobacterium sp. B18]
MTTDRDDLPAHRNPPEVDRVAAAAAAVAARRARAAVKAKDRMREEMGPEFDEVDWQKLDPRQYDPRRIIRDALLDSGSSVAAVQTAQVTASKVRATAPVVPLAVGEAAPFDAEAT